MPVENPKNHIEETKTIMSEAKKGQPRIEGALILLLDFK